MTGGGGNDSEAMESRGGCSGMDRPVRALAERVWIWRGKLSLDFVVGALVGGGVTLVVGVVALFVFGVLGVDADFCCIAKKAYASKDVEKLREAFARMLPAGASEMVTLWHSEDIGAHVIKFRWLPGRDQASFVAEFQKSQDFSNVSPNSTIDLTFCRDKCDDPSPRLTKWRVLYDTASGEVTALYSGLDSPAEWELYPALVGLLHCYHARREWDTGARESPFGESTR